MLFGLGYAGRDLGDFVDLLRDNGVTVLVDVRLNAVSRKRGFSKNALRDALGAAGIAYRHARALGNPKGDRDAFRADDPAARERLRALLRAGDESSAELARLATLAATERVAVLCVERDHTTCHRQVVLDLLPGEPVHLP